MKVVRLVFHLQLGCSLEDHARVTAPPVGLIKLLGRMEAGAHNGCAVVFGLVVCSRVEHGTCAIAATPDLHRQILLWNQLRIETTESDMK